MVSYTWSQEELYDQKTYNTLQIQNADAPKIDGKLEEPVWDLVEWSGNFIERTPDENSLPSQPTAFKILYDQKFLYVAIKAYDSIPEQIEQRMSRRDGFEGDFVEVVFASIGDKRTAYSFTTTAAGVKGDEFITFGDGDESWNPIWYTASSIEDNGYMVESKIPFSQLKFGDDPEQSWGLQVNRRIFREDEVSVWDRVPLDVGAPIAEIGTLKGLKNIIPQKQLEIQPFVVAQNDRYPREEGNPFKTGNDQITKFGLDAKIGVTNDLTLDLTINPDFGQVEADPGAIALDGFQIFFREQRPFFIENNNIFDYGFADGNDNLFYSRRIGRSPQGFVSRPAGAYVNTPNNTTILGAAKFSGKTKDGLSIGIINALTAEMSAEIRTEDERSSQVVEPLTNYSVVRLQQDLNERQSFVGLMLTGTNRQLPETLNYLHKSAYSYGVDFAHSWDDFSKYLVGTFVGSTVNGTPEAITRTQRSIVHLFQRSDASHVEVDTTLTRLSGTGGRLEFGKQGGSAWTYQMGTRWRSPGLETNDIGFLRQADDIRQYNRLNYRTLRAKDWYRNINLNFSQFTAFDFEGNFNRIQFDTRTSINFKNFWSVSSGLFYKPRIFTNTHLRGGPRWRFNREMGGYLFFESDSRKRFRFGGGYIRSVATENQFSFLRYQVGFSYQPTDRLNLELEVEYNERPSQTQYLTAFNFNENDNYLLADINNNQLSTVMRLNYSITPNMSLQFYGEPFITSVDYKRFNTVNNPIAKSLDDRISYLSDAQVNFENNRYLVDFNQDQNVDLSFQNPDFTYFQFRSNLVFRWEYIPGSELFLVWNRGISNYGSLAPSLGDAYFDQLSGENVNNTFLIKATYRFIR